MALTVLDASVLIAHLDVADDHHTACREALASAAADDLHVPASAYAEALVQPARAGRAPEVKAAFDRLGLVVGAIDASVAEGAAELRASHRSLRLPDALVLAYAEAVAAERVLTTDHRWRRFEPVEIVA